MRIRTVAIAFLAIASTASAEEAPLFASVGESTRAPIGWIDFCARYTGECDAKPSPPRDIVLTKKASEDINRINKLVNDKIKPIIDKDHWGVVEQWDYPDDGRGDCEDYALLKRKMLIKAGWPREALLITVVHEKNGDGHAVLTVKTNKGEFVLDNQVSEILLWSKTTYSFFKRQSQANPNSWVSLEDPRSVTSTIKK